MPKLSANLSLMFPELPFLERFAAAAAAGFRGVEWMFSYDIPAEEVRAQLDRHSLEAVLFNLPAGDWSAGERGIAGLVGREAEFRDSVDIALAYARTLDCPRLHVMAGTQQPGVARDAQIAVLIENVRHACAQSAGQDLTWMIEPLNRSVDIPGYLISGSAEGTDLIRQIDRPDVRLQYDVYHMQIVEGDLARTIERLLPSIAHIQIADNPGRHEPGTGEIAFEWLLPQLDLLGYDGWVGCEYRPKAGTAEGLGWAKRWLG